MTTDWLLPYRHEHVLVDFGLGLLLNGLKHKQYGEECLEPLDNLFAMLTELLKVPLRVDCITTLRVYCNSPQCCELLCDSMS